ncbi:MAG: hypothetical protein HRT90_00665, partial [Candidatus Margulisbacteria bacterium]|nr:hypothetical protein [Candidatus Margulisiibacteriota bacterium]
DAIWVSMEMNPKWQEKRDNQIDKIVGRSVRDVNFWLAEGDWEDMSRAQQRQFIQKYSDQNSESIGNTNEIPVVFINHPRQSLYGIYEFERANGGDLSVNTNSDEFTNFYNVIETTVHEGAGHGYQDFILENKENYTRQNPEFKDQVDKFELSYDQKTWPTSGSYYTELLDHYIYLQDASEKDAFYLGREASSKINHNKPVGSSVR